METEKKASNELGRTQVAPYTVSLRQAFPPLWTLRASHHGPVAPHALD